MHDSQTQPPAHVVMIPKEMAGARVDQVLAALFPAYSRSRLQRWLRDGYATVDGRRAPAKERVRGGERVELRPVPVGERAWSAQPLPLDIVHEDPHLIVLDKPPGMVVHPGAGNPDGTLVNALLHYDPDLAGVPRAGIVHRLDKDTSGLLAVARNLPAHKSLVDQLKRRSMQRTYDAVVTGVVVSGSTIDAPVGRHPTLRTRMAVVTSGKPATTQYRVVERFRTHTHLRVMLGTGRTHQIRVHMAHIGYPVLGDPVYGRRLRARAAGAGGRRGDAAWELARSFSRQALHASEMTLVHPRSERRVRFATPLPADMQELLAALRALAQA